MDEKSTLAEALQLHRQDVIAEARARAVRFHLRMSPEKQAAAIAAGWSPPTPKEIGKARRNP